MAAVSPAVIVPCLMRLRRKGYGVSKGIPTLVLAVSGIDDAASVAVFGILISVIFPSNSLTMTIVSVRNCCVNYFAIFLMYLVNNEYLLNNVIVILSLSSISWNIISTYITFSVSGTKYIIDTFLLICTKYLLKCIACN